MGDNYKDTNKKEEKKDAL